MCDGFRSYGRRLNKEYHAHGREGGGERAIDKAPEAVALYGALGNLFAHYHSHTGACGGLVFGGNTRPSGRPAGLYDLADVRS